MQARTIGDFGDEDVFETREVCEAHRRLEAGEGGSTIVLANDLR